MTSSARTAIRCLGRWQRLWAMVLCLWGGGSLAAQDIRLPLDVSHALLGRFLVQRAFTGAGQTLRVGDDGSGCRFLELSDPRVGARGANLTVLTNARGRLGSRIGERCVMTTQWQGRIEFVQALAVSGDGRRIEARVVETRMLDAKGRPDTLANTVWRWARPHVQPRFETAVLDLGRPLAELSALVPLVLPKSDAARVAAAARSARVSAIAVNARGVVATVRMLAPPVAAHPPPAPRLTHEELQRFLPQLQRLDAFVTYLVKQAADEHGAEALADELLEVLIDARHRIVATLAQDSAPGTDPVRGLFFEVWTRLAPLMKQVAERHPDPARALAYLSVINSTEALRTLDRLGPGLGLDLSADGLRRLARGLARGDARDPVQYDEGVDPQLRRRFGFGAPPPPPAPGADVGASWFAWLLGDAHAAEKPTGKVLERLNNWVPKPTEIPAYLPIARDVLLYAAAERLREASLEKRFHPIYRRLMLAAAWQESCWRQFVAHKGKRVPLKSGSGDVGVMQVNARVWRGFYDQKPLAWDFAYNARAGAEVLMYYLTKYAVRHREHEVTRKVDNLARSAYAAYNGGPKAYDRYRRADAPPYARKVDESFESKYRDITNEAHADKAVKRCYAG